MPRGTVNRSPIFHAARTCPGHDVEKGVPDPVTCEKDQAVVLEKGLLELAHPLAERIRGGTFGGWDWDDEENAERAAAAGITLEGALVEVMKKARAI